LVARFLLLWFFGAYALNAYCQVFDIPHANEVPTRTLLVTAQNPKALVLLFPGGGGMMRLKDDGSTNNRHTFIRSINLWAPYQIDAVLVDTPYDLGNLKKGDLRSQQGHLDRVGEVVRFYKNKTGLPIWIFGHSMGTSTATNFVNQVNGSSQLLVGIIIAGTIRTASVNDAVSLPIEVIHHAQDQCDGSPPSASERIVSGRSKSVVSNLEMIEGGITEGNVCDSFAYHGFNQTEPELIKRAAQFILSH
jgi:pimeloyl-ACP methyl ester carboxylesterase